MWTNQMQETLNSKKKGDAAFRHKDFNTAIECYTQDGRIDYDEFVAMMQKGNMGIGPIGRRTMRNTFNFAMRDAAGAY